MQTADASSTTRRILLAKAAAGAAIVAVPAGATMADVSRTEGDAELLALGQALVQAWRREHLAGEAQRANYGDEHLEHAVDEAYDAGGLIADRIVAMPATTLAGLGIKALAYCWCSGIVDDPSQYGCSTDDLAAFIVQGVVRLGEAAHG